MFIDINSELKGVKQLLLQEFSAELHWNVTDPEIRVRAILSKAIRFLDAGPDSPFLQQDPRLRRHAGLRPAASP